MQAIVITETVTVCEGTPSPSPRHNAGLPSLLLCPDGSLLLAHRIGTHKNSRDGTQFLWRSRDQGKTWSSVGFPFTTTPSGAAAELRTAALSNLGDGRIAMLLTWIIHPNDTAPLVNPDTQGLLPIHIGWTVSTDNGGAWSSLQEIDVEPFVQPCGNGPLLRLPNGRLLAAFESYKHYDDPAPWSSRSAVILSEDNGRTWAKPLVVACDPAHVLSFWDQNIQLLADGTLISLIWADDRNRPGASEIYCSRSHDFGETWTTPGPIGISGQHSKPLLLPDSRLLLFYVVRHGDSAIRIAVSSDQGGNWRTNDDWLLYSQRANDLAALEDRGHGEYAAYLQGMGQWSFGWPSAVVLEDGQILASYYAGHGDRSSVYVRRLLVTGSGHTPHGETSAPGNVTGS